MSGTAGLRIRPNHPVLKLRWNQWSLGFSWACFSTGIRFAQVYLGPLHFEINF